MGSEGLEPSRDVSSDFKSEAYYQFRHDPESLVFPNRHQFLFSFESRMSSRIGRLWLGWRDSNPRGDGVKVRCLTAWQQPIMCALLSENAEPIVIWLCTIDTTDGIRLLSNVLSYSHVHVNSLPAQTSNTLPMVAENRNRKFPTSNRFSCIAHLGTDLRGVALGIRARPLRLCAFSIFLSYLRTTVTSYSFCSFSKSPFQDLEGVRVVSHEASLPFVRFLCSLSIIRINMLSGMTFAITLIASISVFWLTNPQYCNSSHNSRAFKFLFDVPLFSTVLHLCMEQ